MRDYLTIGPTPPAEDCVGMGHPDYHRLSVIESYVYIRQLLRVLGSEPALAQLKRKRFTHEEGDYHEVVCYYEDTDEESSDYALKCEGEGPEKWDEIALKELKDEGYFLKGTDNEIRQPDAKDSLSQPSA